MTISQSIRRFRVPILMSVLVLPAAVFAFAAANSVPITAGGEGTNLISGYTTSNIHYTLNTVNPEQVDNVSFDLTPDIPGAPNPTVVKAKLIGAADYDNGTLAGTAVSVTSWIVTPTVTTLISDTNSLSIIATQ